ncbi:MAG: DUF177 domain-containing protein [Desulfitobacteriaceae bacterium]|nr:DUF177 domain-containing protein [Desulfitobacteriaceae bacterium]
MNINVEKVKNVPGKVIKAEATSEPNSYSVGAEMISAVSPISFSGTVENSGHGLVIDGEISTIVEMPCSRCAEKLQYPVQVPFHEVYMHRRETATNEEEVYFYEGDKIDILPQVLQAFLLELPMKVLCREECKGLCPACGTNLNIKECRCERELIDPRLAALKNLLNDRTEGGVTSGSTNKKNL